MIGLGVRTNKLRADNGGGGNVAPSNVTAPVISGSTSLGSVLSTTNGTWSGTPATFSYTYQWKRNGSPIGGATASTYTTVVADSTANITCDVTADNGVAPPATAGSNTLTMANYTPANTVLPAVTGTAVVGQTLSTTNGTWTNSPSTYSYQWYRGATLISGATSSTYTLVQADAGNTSNIKCVVTASNGLSASTDSNTIVEIYDAMAWDYRQRVIAAGGTMSLSRLQLLQGTVIIPNKTLLEKLNFGAGVNKGALHVYTAENTTQALTNILNPNFTATTINSPTFTTDSFYTGGTGIAINSNWNPSTLSLGTNEIIIAAAYNNIPTSNAQLIGVLASPAANGCYSYVDATIFASRMLTATERSASTTNGRIGWNSLRRLGTSMIWNSNTDQKSFIDAATGVFANLNFYDLAANNNGTISSGSNRQQCFAIKGAYITDSELSTLRTSLRNYCLAINPALVI